MGRKYYWDPYLDYYSTYQCSNCKKWLVHHERLYNGQVPEEVGFVYIGKKEADILLESEFGEILFNQCSSLQTENDKRDYEALSLNGQCEHCQHKEIWYKYHNQYNKVMIIPLSRA